MPRLEGESIENYRARLSMKGIISEWGGTKSGILYALTSLGYEQSTIEPFSYQDPERWAEFIVFLKGSKQSGVNNLAVIDAEVRKVKEVHASSSPGSGEVEFPKVGTIAASEKFYQPCAFVMYEGLSSNVEVGSKASTGAKIYPVCSPVLRCSGVTFMTEGGENHAEDNHIGRD